MTVDLAFLENAGPVLHAHDFRRLLRGIYLGDGVVQGADLDVTQRGAGANRSVDVAVGQAVINDGATPLAGLFPFISDAVVNVPLDAADPTNPRIDLIVARVLDTEMGDGSDTKLITFKKGTAAASPVSPTASARELELARVAVAAGATTITNANITERRVWADGAKLPRGIRKQASTTSTNVSSTTAVAIGASTVTDTAEAFRAYRYMICVRCSSTVASDIATVRLQMDGADYPAGGVQADVSCTAAGVGYMASIFGYVLAPSAGSHTWRAVIARGAGSGTVTAQTNGVVILEDIGSAAIT